MNRILPFTCMAFIGLAHAAERPVLLNKNLPLRSGTVLREKREIRVDNGVSRQVNAKTKKAHFRRSPSFDVRHR